MERTTETMVDMKYKEEAAAVMDFLNSLSREEKEKFLMCIKFTKFMEQPEHKSA